MPWRVSGVSTPFSDRLAGIRGFGSALRKIPDSMLRLPREGCTRLSTAVRLCAPWAGGEKKSAKNQKSKRGRKTPPLELAAMMG